jgi:hypothetical protein
MKIFLSYGSQDKSAAESIAFSLRSRGYTVFLDRDDLPPGGSYDDQIERAVKDSDIFVFLICPDSVMDGRYTLTELTFARQKWSNPNGRVLPVMMRKTPMEKIPPYLKAVTVLEPVGSIAAETSAAVDNMQRTGPRPMKWDASGIFARYRYALALAAVGAIVTFGFILFASTRSEHSTSINTSGPESPVVQGTQGDVNINFGSPTSPRPAK